MPIVRIASLTDEIVLATVEYFNLTEGDASLNVYVASPIVRLASPTVGGITPSVGLAFLTVGGTSSTIRPASFH